jgi:hypothetical protein
LLLLSMRSFNKAVVQPVGLFCGREKLWTAAVCQAKDSSR